MMLGKAITLIDMESVVSVVSTLWVKLLKCSFKVSVHKSSNLHLILTITLLN